VVDTGLSITAQGGNGESSLSSAQTQPITKGFLQLPQQRVSVQPPTGTGSFLTIKLLNDNHSDCFSALLVASIRTGTEQQTKGTKRWVRSWVPYSASSCRAKAHPPPLQASEQSELRLPLTFRVRENAKGKRQQLLRKLSSENQSLSFAFFPILCLNFLAKLQPSPLCNLVMALFKDDETNTNDNN
jgi:hypothetical protein